jgi:hypothetical protein
LKRVLDRIFSFGFYRRKQNRFNFIFLFSPRKDSLKLGKRSALIRNISLSKKYSSHGAIKCRYPKSKIGDIHHPRWNEEAFVGILLLPLPVFRNRIQHFRLNTDPNPGFFVTKNLRDRNYSWKNLYFDQNCHLLIPRPPQRTSKLQ